MLHAADLAPINQLSHTVKVDQQAQEDFVGRGAVLVNPRKIAKNSDAGDILAMERKHARGLGSEVGRAVGRRDVAMDGFVVHVVRGGYFGEEPRNHLDDLCDWHGADLKLSLRPSRNRWLPGRQHIFIGQALDVG